MSGLGALIESYSVAGALVASNTEPAKGKDQSVLKSMKGAAVVATAALVAGMFAPSATSADEPVPATRDDAGLGAAVAAPDPAMAAGVIVKYREGTKPAELRAVVHSLSDSAVTITSVAPRVRAFVTEIAPVADAAELAAELEQRSDVEWAEPNGISYPLADSPWPVPVNDPYSTNLRNVWDIRGPENTSVTTLQVTPWPVGGYSTKAPALWPATSGRGLVVAVLDTGIIASHPDLAPNLVPGYDMVSAGAGGSLISANDGDGRDPDAGDPGDWSTANLCYSGQGARNSTWHGTHVAGTIGAVGNNGVGVVGVAPGVRIQPLRVLGRCGGTNADIAAAITWAAGAPVPGLPPNPTPAKVLNLSLGGSGACSQVTVDAINAARGQGASLLVALGNDGAPASGYNPANCAGIIGVHSTSDYGDHASYSNYGPEADVSAPGGEPGWGENDGIFSTVDTGTTTPAGAGYGWKSGTSMATPAAAGIAAMLASVGQFTPDQLEAALKASVAGFPSGNTSYGYAACNTTNCGTGVVDATKIPAPISGPGIAGVPVVGQTLTAVGGPWHGPAVGHAFTWFANDQVVGSGPTYVVSSTDVGKAIVVRESVASGVYAPIGANSAGVVAQAPVVAVTKKKSKLKLSIASKRVRGRLVLVVKVKVKGVKKPTGKIRIKVGKAKAKAKLKAKRKGTIRFVLPRLRPGKHKVTVTYSGNSRIQGAKVKRVLRVGR